MVSTRSALILFARDPVPGKVKTRLLPEWDAGQVCGLYRCFLEDTLRTLDQVEVDRRFVGVHPAPASGFFDGPAQQEYRLFEQQGEDLGDRMRRAFADRFAEGFDRVLIIGADSPSLPVDYLNRALASARDMMLGPSTDGGYYLIGMNRKVHDVFSGVPWGTSGVLGATGRHIARLGLSVEVLPPWYDVDVPEDVRFMKAHLDMLEQGGQERAPTTRGYLNQLLER
jgi:rSAM/selenodomain-associated transferase 1